MSSAVLCKKCDAVLITALSHVGALTKMLPPAGTVLDLSNDDFERKCYIEWKYEQHDTYPDFPVLGASVEAGCNLCALLMNGIDRHFSEKICNACDRHFWVTSEHHAVTIYRVRYVPAIYSSTGLPIISGAVPDLPVLVFSVSEQDTEPFELIFNLLAEPGNPICICQQLDQLLSVLDDPVAKYLQIDHRPVSGPLLSASNVDMIKNWIVSCVDNHDLCSNDMSGYLPTRLIDVGGRSGKKEPHLIETAYDLRLALRKRNPWYYVTLSYCWGAESPNNKPLKTKKNTYQKMLCAIPINEMPQTLRDAVIVTRTLGLRYLWIDSLCIIQDDESDWQKEAARMMDIYSHSYLTIAATSSASTSDGFLSRATPPPSIEINFTSANNPNITGSYVLRPSLINEAFMADVLEKPWSERGWTFQEEMLSRRVLYFGESMLHFQCQERYRREDTNESRLTETQFWRSGLQSTQDKRALYRFWYTSGTRYSCRKLTFPQDKLPAISGFAHEVARTLGDCYLAGLWRNDLVLGLLWKTNSASKFSDLYLGPSWSWVSSSGYIEWGSARHMGHLRVVDQCEIVEAKTTVPGDDPTGRVIDGYLTLSGKLKLLNKAQFVQYEGTRNAQDIVLDGCTIARCSLSEPILAGSEEDEVGEAVDIWMLRLVVTEEFEASGEDASENGFPKLLQGLLLTLPKSVNNNERHGFRRVGMFSVDLEDPAAFWDEDTFITDTITII